MQFALLRTPTPRAFASLRKVAALLVVGAVASASSLGWSQNPQGTQSAAESILNPNRRVSTFDLVDGLPSLGVSCLHHDHDGILWVGTFGGLVTFDGSDFLKPGPIPPSSNLRKPEPETKTVSSVQALELDQQGRMWCGGNRGQILRYDGLRAHPTQITSPLSVVDVLYCAQDGAIWVGGDKLLRYGHASTQPSLEFALRTGESIVNIGQARVANEVAGPVWIATTHRVLNWTATSGISDAAEGGRLSLFFDTGGHRWEVLDGDRVLVDGVERLTLRESLGRSHGTVDLDSSRTAVAFDHVVAVATYDEDAPSIELTDLTGSPRSMMRAPHGAVWLGMEPEGLLLLEPCHYRILDLPHPGNSLGAVGAFDGRTLLIGSDLDQRLWTIDSGAVPALNPPSESSPSVVSKVLLTSNTPFIGYSSAFVQDSAGRRYVGDSSGLHLFSEGQLSLIEGAELGPVTSLTADGAERVWAAHADRIAEYHAGVPTGRTWQGKPGWFTKIVFHDGRVYAARDDMVLELDMSSQGLVEIARFPGLIVRCLYVGAGGDLWITTYGDGLYRRRSSGTLDHYGLREGLPNAFLGWIGPVPGPTEHTHLWMNSNAGAIAVSRRDLDAIDHGHAGTSAFRLINTPEANGREGAALDNGFLYLPTMSGVVAVDSRMQLSLSPPAPPTLALQSSFSGGSPIDSNTELAGTADLEFEFSAALFPSSRSAFIEHRLVGHDPTWRQAGRARSVRYAQLGPGNYQFEVRGRAPGGTFGPVQQHPEIVVQKRWYQRNDLRAIGFLAAVLTIIAAAQVRTRQVLRRNQALKTEVQRELAVKELRSRLAQAEESERGRIARELHDDYSQRLVAYGIAVKLASEADEPNSSTLASLDEVYSGIELLAHDLHDLSRRLHPTVLEDLGLICALRSECARRAALAAVPVDVRFECDLDENTLALDRNSALALFRVGQEALSNAIKHGEPERIVLRLDRSEDELQMKVTDNGTGIADDPSMPRGLGITSMHERMALAGGAIEIQSEPNRGTSIVARLKETKS